MYSLKPGKVAVREPEESIATIILLCLNIVSLI
jgi:hypothetical protein